MTLLALFQVPWVGPHGTYPETAQLSSDVRLQSGLGLTKNILVVDDEEEILALIANALSPSYGVLTALDGNSCLQIARSVLPDLIILDVRMPGPSGYEICWALKSQELTSNIKILIITGYGGEADSTLARELGADGYLKKPFSMSNLREEIARLLEG